jgi:NADH-quinone oxidoreductase subunit C
MAKLDHLEQLLTDRLPHVERHRLADAIILRVTPDTLLETMLRLRDDPDLDFKQMIDLAGVHYPERDKPFEVVYQLLSVRKNHRVRVKLAVDEQTPVPTVTSVWWCADWFEREAYEMFGILFAGHPDLRRLLTDYDFEGFPLRKDFPLSGLSEVRYDPAQKRVIRQPLQMVHPNREPYQVNPA